MSELQKEMKHPDEPKPIVMIRSIYEQAIDQLLGQADAHQVIQPTVEELQKEISQLTELKETLERSMEFQTPQGLLTDERLGLLFYYKKLQLVNLLHAKTDDGKAKVDEGSLQTDILYIDEILNVGMASGRFASVKNLSTMLPVIIDFASNQISIFFSLSGLTDKNYIIFNPQEHRLADLIVFDKLQYEVTKVYNRLNLDRETLEVRIFPESLLPCVVMGKNSRLGNQRSCNSYIESTVKPRAAEMRMITTRRVA